jgi:UDP-2,3-diacylglucosamine pyrophosphatase LpxH
VGGIAILGLFNNQRGHRLLNSAFLDERDLDFQVVLISDIHVGEKHTYIPLLGEFLRHVRTRYLIVDGDNVDGEVLIARPSGTPPEFSEMDKRYFDSLYYQESLGAELLGTPGNHDEELRRSKYRNIMFGPLRMKPFHAMAVEMRNATEYYLVAHMDQATPASLRQGLALKTSRNFREPLMRYGRKIEEFSHRRFNRHFAAASLARDIPDAILRTISVPFRRNIVAFVKYLNEQGAHLSGAIAGHVHKDELTEENGIIYGNSGDWMMHATALVLTHSGEWKLINWLTLRKQLKLGNPPEESDLNPLERFRPQTERMIRQIGEIWPGEGRIHSEPVGLYVPITARGIMEDLEEQCIARPA